MVPIKAKLAVVEGDRCVFLYRFEFRFLEAVSGQRSLLIVNKVLPSTLVFQLEDTVCLFGTLLLLDPIHFPKGEPCLIIGSVCPIGALLGTSLYI